MYFSYNSGGNDVPEGAFKISPSQLGKFFSETPTWYREHVLDEGASFTGNTSSVLGTCVHAMAEMYFKERRTDYSLVEAFLNTVEDPDIDVMYIRQQYPMMAETLINSVVCNFSKEGKAEPFLWTEIIPGYGVGGSIDMLQPADVFDYKTTGALSPPTKIPKNYWFQQMTYVWLARKHGYNVERFHLDFITHHTVGRVSPKTNKPMKDYPSTHTRLTHVVSNDDLLIIDNVLQLVAESAKAFKEQPGIRHLLAQDLRLKQATKFAFS